MSYRVILLCVTKICALALFETKILALCQFYKCTAQIFVTIFFSNFFSTFFSNGLERPKGVLFSL